MAGRPKKTQGSYMQILVLFSQAEFLTKKICHFLALELKSFEMLHVLISVKLVPDGKFPTFVLLVTKSLCTITTLSVYQSSQYICSSLQKYAETGGSSAFFSGLWGAWSVVSSSSVYAIPHSRSHATVDLDRDK